jgi:hypothetical protein
LERKDDLWRNDAGSISALSARCDVTENTENPNDPDFCEAKIFSHKYRESRQVLTPDGYFMRAAPWLQLTASRDRL